ncbi:hypothetical protein A2985_02280 [Candidatus Woesebacteria bacterium RIFCSPLOWO2_01_FULL_43_11]|uniref:Uncharacterized protein n=1 Tax=Candidatus Woesebacteria bacterium RBG_16_42_24 TaxID=1802485 RepID=A0A1F7XKD0_9BACT|nr:MAG: hypothetical protein A2V97_02420 [Candidatus Woesebacteria bacterium RBG_16_42_24]OGM68340.1 MAG: hypothetical protein A2985_02280 [Candidatus Woesebacteria bacterium RIFCSPLOWO2_01_FULL_43_11]
MIKLTKEEKEKKIKELEEKLEKYSEKLAKKKLGYGDVVRTRFGDSYSDQLRDDTNALELVINSIKEELDALNKVVPNK